MALMSRTSETFLATRLTTRVLLVRGDTEGGVIETTFQGSVDLVEGQRVGYFFHAELADLFGLVKAKGNAI